jgi:hypothetical protein
MAKHATTTASPGARRPQRLRDLPRNDVAACQRFYEENGVNDEQLGNMMMLQDDPTDLERVARTWTVLRTEWA